MMYEKSPKFLIIILIYKIYTLFGEKIEIEWNQDLNSGGLGMELES